MTAIKIDHVLKGEDIPLALGVEFELKPGISVKVKPPTYALVKAFDEAGLQEKDKRTAYEAALARVQLIVDAPKELDWQEVLMPMLYALHDHFLALALRITVPQTPSSAT